MKSGAAPSVMCKTCQQPASKHKGFSCPPIPPHRRYYYGPSKRAACCTGTVRGDHADEVMATCEMHNQPLHWEDDE